MPDFNDEYTVHVIHGDEARTQESTEGTYAECIAWLATKKNIIGGNVNHVVTPRVFKRRPRGFEIT